MKNFKEYLGLPTIRVGGLDSVHPIASLGDTPPKGKGSRDSRATGLVANYDTQAPGTMRPFLTANLETKKTEMMKLMRKAMSTMPGSEKQREIKKQINVIRKELKLEPIKEDLYTDDNPNDTVKGTGYGDATIARKTLRIIKSVDKQRQMQIVNTLYNRAKHHANQTSDMRAAMSIFKNWIDNNKIKESTLYKYMVDKKIIKD